MANALKCNKFAPDKPPHFSILSEYYVSDDAIPNTCHSARAKDAPALPGKWNKNLCPKCRAASQRKNRKRKRENKQPDPQRGKQEADENMIPRELVLAKKKKEQHPPPASQLLDQQPLRHHQQKQTNEFTMLCAILTTVQHHQRSSMPSQSRISIQYKLIRDILADTQTNKPRPAELRFDELLSDMQAKKERSVETVTLLSSLNWEMHFSDFIGSGSFGSAWRGSLSFYRDGKLLDPPQAVVIKRQLSNRKAPPGELAKEFTMAAFITSILSQRCTSKLHMHVFCGRFSFLV